MAQIKSTITWVYRDFYGASASIRVKGDGTAKLIVRDGWGRMMVRKEYNTFKGARIAMGRLSDSWQLWSK